jgi:hypothetical protein
MDFKFCGPGRGSDGKLLLGVICLEYGNSPDGKYSGDKNLITNSIGTFF